MDDILFPLSGQKVKFFIIALLAYQVATYIANDMIMPGMLQVIHHFTAPDSFVPFSLAAFFLGGASLQIFLGPLSDRFGRRPIMIVGAVFFVMTTLYVPLTRTVNEFVFARFLQGMGLCFVSVIGYTALQEIHTEKQAIRLIALMRNITILAPLAGPIVGSIIIEFTTWQVIFYLIAVLAILSLIGLWQFMPETIGNPRTDGTICPATPLKFRIISKNYFHLLTNIHFLFCSIALGLSFAPLIGWIGIAPLILIKEAHLRPLFYALWQTPIFFMVFIGNIVLSNNLNKKSLLELLSRGTIIMIVSLLVMTIILLFNKHYIWLIFGLSSYAFGLSFITGPLNRMILYSTDVPKGTASALANIITIGIVGAAPLLAGWFYSTNNNFYFGIFSLLMILGYSLIFFI